MTQEQALEKAKELLPDIADGLRLARMRSIGRQFGHDNEFMIWDHTGEGAGQRCEILARSEHSWEHALSMLVPEKILKENAPDTSTVDDLAEIPF